MWWKNRKTWLILTAVLIIATAIRLYGIGSESLWFDEAFSVYHAQQSLAHIVTLPDTTPPLYLVILHFFIKIFSTEEFWVRLPSVIFGVLSVMFIYLLAKKFFNQKVGIYAALILAFSSYHIYYSQEARAYTLLYFLSLASMYFFVEYLKSEKKKEGFYYLIFTVLLLYSHIYAIFLVLTQNIVFIFLKAKQSDWISRTKKWFILQFTAFVLFIPWILIPLGQSEELKSSMWITKKHLINLFFVPLGFSGGILLGVIYTSLFVYGLYDIIRKRKTLLMQQKNISLLLILWMTIPVIIPVGYTLFISPIFIPRYIMYCSIPFFIIIGYTIDNLKPTTKYIALAIAILISLSYITAQVEKVEKYPWQSISNYVDSIKEPHDIIIIDYGYNLLPFLYYHDPAYFMNKSAHIYSSENNVFTSYQFDEKKEHVGQADNVICIKTYGDEIPPSDFFQLMKKEHNIQSVKTFSASWASLNDQVFFRVLRKLRDKKEITSEDMSYNTYVYRFEKQPINQ